MPTNPSINPNPILSIYAAAVVEPNPGGVCFMAWAIAAGAHVIASDAVYYGRGDGLTNLSADYLALLAALKVADKDEWADIRCVFSSSQLPVKWLNGVWQLNKPELQALNDQVSQALLGRVIEWCPADANPARQLVWRAFKEAQTV